MKDDFGNIDRLVEEINNRNASRDGDRRLRDVRESHRVTKQQEDQVAENIKRKTEISRVDEVRRDDDVVEDLNISLEDIDNAIFYQFNEVFDLSVSQNGERIEVPVIYDNPERWAWAAKQRDLRSLTDRVVLPIVSIKRDSIDRETQRESQPTLNIKHGFAMTGKEFTVEQRWDNKNRYDNFSILNDRAPVRQIYKIKIPRYVSVSYSFTIYTEYMSQMNRLIEEISYYSYDYWGNPKTGKLFKVVAQGFNTDIQQQQEARYIETNFNAQVKAYIIPKTETSSATSIKKQRTKAQIITTESIRSFPEQKSIYNR